MQFIKNSNFELVDEDYINTIKQRYDYCVVDYVRLKLNGTYEGVSTHRAAAIYAMRKILFDHNEFLKSRSLPKDDDTINEAKMIGVSYPLDHFFARPEWHKKEDGCNNDGKPCYCNPWKIAHYAYAFCAAPYSPKNKEFLDDWETVNKDLFSNRERLIIYSWNDDWQDYYFSAGQEWWRCFFWTVFDPNLNLFTTVAASTTD